MISVTIQDDNKQHDALPKSSPVTRAICVECDGRIWKAPLEISLNYYLEQGWHAELRWYIEDHLIDEPFATRRAYGVYSQLVAIGKVLATYMEKWSKSCASSIFDENILVLVIDDPDSRSIVARLPWETLEDPSIWDASLRPKNILVNRLVPRTEVLVNSSCPQIAPTVVTTYHGLAADSADAFTSSSARGIHPLEACRSTLDSAPDKNVSSRGRQVRNILVLTARPTGNEDIPFRAVSFEIHKAVTRRQKISPSSCHLHICRPGTLAALESELKARDPGHYDVVHLDTHGWVDGERLVSSASYMSFLMKRSAYLDFVENNAGFLSAKSVSVVELVPLILERRVSAIILNSCRSAASGEGIANVARSFVAAGVPTAVGMTFKISDTAAAIFTAALYNSYLNQSTTIAHAAAEARNALRLQPQRLSYLNYKIRLADHIVPRVYVGGFKSELSDLPNRCEPGSALEPSDTNSGREADLFELETSLATGCRIIHLQGPPGIGKTWLITCAMTWWTETDFAQCHYVQCSTPIDSDALEVWIKSAITTCKTILPDRKPLPERKIFVFDSLESLTFANLVAQPKEERNLQLKLRRFIKRIVRENENVDVILASRANLQWFDRPEGRLRILAGLKQRHALQLALQRADELKVDVPMVVREARIHMQLCIELVNGNPLAVEIMMRAFSMLQITIEGFYNRLLSGEPIPIDWVWVKGSEGARFLRMLKQNDAEGSKLNKFYSLAYLAYFWGKIPADHLSYKFFLARALRAYQLVYADPVHVLGAQRSLRDLPLWLSWKTYELVLGNETLLERTLTDRTSSKMEDGVNYPITDPEFPGAILRGPDSDLEWPIGHDQLNITLSDMSRRGMISESYTSAGPSRDSISDERYHLVSPVTTLFMRDQLHAYPRQLRHAGEMAFVRYHGSRLERMPIYETQLGAVVEAVTKRLHSEFENFMTAANMILDFDFTSPLCIFGYAMMMSLSHWSDLPPHRLFYYSGYLRRVLERIDPLLRSDYCGDRGALGLILLRHDSDLSIDIEILSAIYASNHRITLQVTARSILRRALELSGLIGLPSHDPYLHSVRHQLESTHPAELDDLTLEVAKLFGPEQLEQAKLVLHQPSNIHVQGMPRKNSDCSAPDLSMQEHVNHVLRSLPHKKFHGFTLTEVQTTRTTLLQLLALCTDPTTYPSERWQIHTLLACLAIEFDEIAEAKAYLKQIQEDFQINQFDMEGSNVAPRLKKMGSLIEARLAAHELPLRMYFATENRQQLWSDLVRACHLAEVDFWTAARSSEILLQAAMNGNFLPEARENLDELRAYWENDSTDVDEQKKQLSWLQDVEDVLTITWDFATTLHTVLDQNPTTDYLLADLGALSKRLEHFLTTRGDCIDIGHYMKINGQLRGLYLIMLEPAKVRRCVDKRNEAMRASYLGEGFDLPTDYNTSEICSILATLPEGSKDRNKVIKLLLARITLIEFTREVVPEETKLMKEIETIQNRALIYYEGNIILANSTS